jgi:hypothetical protein
MTHPTEKDAPVWCSEHMAYCPRHTPGSKPPTCPCCGYTCEFPRLCDVCVEEEHETPCRVLPPGSGDTP